MAEPTNIRIGGSGLTVFQWNNQPIAYAQSVIVQDATPVAPPSVIQPLDQPRPLEIVTAQAIGAISLQVQLFERFNSKVWDQMMDVIDQGNGREYNDLADVFNRMSELGRGVTASKVVYKSTNVNSSNPAGQSGVVAYTDVFHNVKITDVRDDENIDISTMEIIKSIGMMATHKTRSRQTVIPSS